MLGMHRSGTSLITRMLNLLGVYLGPDERLMKPQEDNNPRGFWEHQLITDLNDAILARLGGSWHEPPTFFPGWESAPELADLRQRARAVINEDFAAAECWGWKDPRTCLTLPFWQRLSPPTRYVVCLRNPVDVAHSLQRRDGFSAEKSAGLWLTYMASALAHTAGQPRMLVFYEDVMWNRQAELRRLARFVDAHDLAESDATQSAVREFVEEELQHHRTSVIDATDDGTLPFSAKSLYVTLRLYAELDRDGVGGRSVSEAVLRDCVDRLGLYAVTAQTELDRHRAALAESEKETSSELERHARELADKEAEVEAARQACAGLSAELATTRSGLDAREAELHQGRELRDQLSTELAAARASLALGEAELTQVCELRDRLSAELAAARTSLDVREAEIRQVHELRDRLLVDLEAAQARANAAEVGMNAIEEQRAVLEGHLRAIGTRAGCLGLGVRLFLGARAHEVIGRIYRSIWRAPSD
ncbi:MAG: hypothetical protein DME04_01620 [Candidatus Rokuibacteriota bacterium]|nr:MAG: hypothetical protein DME04_01620 [Candidatus Rokubacteria bacterium]